jgi:hypothetical protein
MMNLKERQEQLNTMTIQVLKDTFKPIYGLSFKRCKRKADIIAEIVDYEIFLAETYEECNGLEGAYDFAVARKAKHEENRQAKRDAKNVVSTQASNEDKTWWNLVVEMNMKDGNPHVYEHTKDRPMLDQVLLYTVREIYYDAQRAERVFNGTARKTDKKFGSVFVASKKQYSGLFMKDNMAKGLVKSVANNVINKENRKEHFHINEATHKEEYNDVVLILSKLENAGLIYGNKTDKEYAKFYSVHPDKLLAFLNAVGCLKK